MHAPFVPYIQEAVIETHPTAKDCLRQLFHRFIKLFQFLLADGCLGRFTSCHPLFANRSFLGWTFADTAFESFQRKGFVGELLPYMRFKVVHCITHRTTESRNALGVTQFTFLSSKLTTSILLISTLCFHVTWCNTCTCHKLSIVKRINKDLLVVLEFALVLPCRELLGLSMRAWVRG